MTEPRPPLRRPALERTAPIRDFSALLKEPAAEQSAGAQSAAAPSARANGFSSNAAFGDTVAESVKLGYSVIQEQIRQGRRIAEQVSERGLHALGPNNETTKILERMMHFSTDFGALLVDMTETLWRVSASAHTRSRPSHDDAPTAGNAASANVALEIESRRPTKIILDLKTGNSASALATRGLFALDGDAAPLTDIAFLPGAPGQVPTLKIRIPDAQPVGTYTGAVVDRENHEPHGTISIRILE